MILFVIDETKNVWGPAWPRDEGIRHIQPRGSKMRVLGNMV